MPHERLQGFLAEIDWTQARLARELGCSRVFVGLMLSAARRPGLAVALALERVTRENPWSGGPLCAAEWLVVAPTDPGEAS